MLSPKLRAAIYRALHKDVVKPILYRWVLSGAARRTKIAEYVASVDSTQKREWPVGWFHASSVGELEMLVPVIESWAALSTRAGEKVGIVLTIFSDSAAGPLEKLAARLRESGSRILFAGFAPWEGEWGEALSRLNPEFMLTARYEAWPELWISLADQEIPLGIVGARSRKSLSWARRICAFLGQGLPSLHFFTVNSGDVAELHTEFHDSEVVSTGDPRWERVMQRSRQGNVRAGELIRAHEEFPRPWGVLGSAWKDDLLLFEAVLGEKKLPGTLWIVPHKIDEDSLGAIESILRRAGVQWRRTSGEESGRTPQPTECVLVNEMGFLTELYTAADWAYVGGGFTAGVHNTIEPAIHGIPIACGPKNAEKFPEVGILSSYGQLDIVSNVQGLREWLESTVVNSPTETLEREKERWKKSAEAQRGAGERILRQILQWNLHWMLDRA